ncbi:hypothetical protein J3458_020358 [Metarhizium acridum]|uniref:uncharacterized protein n=1 Tax=Metarhizium acridum TaxID=92637 RepID=UPI001C6D1149|nr:hypothetical protein J3458_020358 [Metarhizium acridum]
MDYDLVMEDEFDALCLDVRRDHDSASKTKYPAKLHARKVVKELGVDDGLIYLPGQPDISLEDSDQPRLFRQRR